VVTPSLALPSLLAGFWRARLQQLVCYTTTRIRAITTARECHAQAITALMRLIKISLLRQNGFYGTRPDRSARDEWQEGYGAAPGRVQGNREGHSAGRALTTDLHLTSAHWLVALAKSSSKGLPQRARRC